ncbi:outer membrane protein assembly factor BamB [Caldanaerobacter subterraneus]|uniref:Outer membrane protein assembly factor BamB n=1 Tax=Caldanaerobacter subterraneus TaxID=911092 RepID=A0A4R2JUB0_9THEO|nr:outer membrane protein assembly factor BamB [Caldanaerobacter subterraneus]
MERSDGNLKQILAIFFSTPAIGTDGTIYLVSGNLYAIKPNGKLKWELKLGTLAVSSPVIASDGTIYVGTLGENEANEDVSYLYAISTDGKIKWKSKVSGRILSSPAIATDGTIYAGSTVSFYAVNPNGTLKWRIDIGEGVISTPAVSQDGTVYVGSDGLYAVEPTGKIKWKFETRNGIFSSPAISSDGTIYVADGGNIFDKKQKEEKNKNICAIDADGKLKWKYTTNSSAIVSSPAIPKGGTVYIGGTDGHDVLYAIDLSVG